MFDPNVLRNYAQIANPESIPVSVRLSHTARSLTIFDVYPKSIFHFLILPRVVPPLTISNLANLKSLLQGDKAHAKGVLLELAEHAKNVRTMIEEEMVSRYGFKWGICTGFHSLPSMTHVHLHVISNDLCSPTMKTKRHYNTFHPKLGFFLHLDQVLEWFDAEPSYYDAMSKLDPSQYEPLIKEDLACWRCDLPMKNIPTLKAHLTEEWEEEAKRSKAKSQQRGTKGNRQRKVEDAIASRDGELETAQEERK